MLTTYLPHYNEAVAQQNNAARLRNFEEFKRMFETLPNPTYVPHVTHPQQIEATETL